MFSPFPSRHHRAFTLIELLIVVAIIAILAAIAVPNFLEAQVRAKVSRAQNDMRTLATAIESYQVDNNAYPMIVAINSQWARSRTGAISGPSLFYPDTLGISSRFIVLTTPVAYLSSIFRDPFINEANRFALDGGNASETPPPLPEYDTFDYVDARSLTPEGILGGSRGAAGTSGASWHVVGAGPDRINAFGGGQSNYASHIHQRGVDYDPSNGTISAGDLVRIGGGQGPLFGSLLPAIDRVQKKYNVNIN
jgi:prepilin-type N-terminal cleavage/methylation domain-containing protein